MKLACPCGGMAIALSRYEPSKSYKAQKAFDCGHGVINNFVARTLKQQTQRNLSVAYVLAGRAPARPRRLREKSFSYQLTRSAASESVTHANGGIDVGRVEVAVGHAVVHRAVHGAQVSVKVPVESVVGVEREGLEAAATNAVR
jgi:hypothetical protein